MWLKACCGCEDRGRQFSDSAVSVRTISTMSTHTSGVEAQDQHPEALIGPNGQVLEAQWAGSQDHCLRHIRQIGALAGLFFLGPRGGFAYMVESGAASNGAPQPCASGAAVPLGGAADAGGAGGRALPRLPGGALGDVGCAVAVPGHHGPWSVEEEVRSTVCRV